MARNRFTHSMVFLCPCDPSSLSQEQKSITTQWSGTPKTSRGQTSVARYWAQPTQQRRLLTLCGDKFLQGGRIWDSNLSQMWVTMACMLQRRLLRRSPSETIG